MSKAKTKRPQRNPVWPIFLMGLGGLLIVGAIVWTVYAASQPTQTSQLVSTTAEENFPNIPRITLADARAAHDAGQALFLDVRDALSFAESHISGAINIPADEIAQRLGELGKEDWIITYCT
jgi:hypothetical protein